jgi:hypothetical protein
MASPEILRLPRQTLGEPCRQVLEIRIDCKNLRNPRLLVWILSEDREKCDLNLARPNFVKDNRTRSHHSGGSSYGQVPTV